MCSRVTFQCVALLGHSDALMGVICTSNTEFGEKMKFLQLGLLAMYVATYLVRY